MVPIGGGSTNFVLSDRWIVYTKSRKQLLHRKYLLYEKGCSWGYLFHEIPSIKRMWDISNTCSSWQQQKNKKKMFNNLIYSTSVDVLKFLIFLPLSFYLLFCSYYTVNYAPPTFCSSKCLLCSSYTVHFAPPPVHLASPTGTVHANKKSNFTLDLLICPSCLQ